MRHNSVVMLLLFFFFFFYVVVFLVVLFICRHVHACLFYFICSWWSSGRAAGGEKNSLMMLYCRWGCWEPSSLVLLKNWSSETESHSRLFCVCMSSAPGALNRYNTVYFALFPYFYVPPDLKALFFFFSSIFQLFYTQTCNAAKSFQEYVNLPKSHWCKPHYTFSSVQVAWEDFASLAWQAARLVRFHVIDLS